jgi:hypothetical protein
MIALPYALLDRICDLAPQLDEAAAQALADVLRGCPDGRRGKDIRPLVGMLLEPQQRAMFDILADTWLFVAPQTSGAEIAAALLAAAVQGRRVLRPPAV